MFRGVVAEIGGVRVIAMDTIASVKQEDAGHVVVCASHGGTSSSYYAQQYPIRAVFFNDAGVGKKNAGILAISIFEGKGIPCGTVSHTSARIGDGLDSWESGILSRVRQACR